MQQVLEVEAALAQFFVRCAGGKSQYMLRGVNRTFSVFSVQTRQKAGFDTTVPFSLPVCVCARALVPANIAFQLSDQLNVFHEADNDLYVVEGHTNAYFTIL
jgi:hypothetical protein